MGRLIGRLRALGGGPAQRRGIHRAIGHGDNRADLGEGGVVEHERLVLGGDAIKDAVGFGAGQHAVLIIDGQSGDVRLPGLIPDFAVAGAIHAEDLALFAGADVEGAIGAHGQRPDVARFGREVFGGLAVLDAVDLAIGRGAGVNRAGMIHREGENLGLGRGPKQRALAGAIDLVQAAAMSGGGVDRTVRGLGQGPR